MVAEEVAAEEEVVDVVEAVAEEEVVDAVAPTRFVDQCAMSNISIFITNSIISEGRFAVQQTLPLSGAQIISIMFRC